MGNLGFFQNVKLKCVNNTSTSLKLNWSLGPKQHNSFWMVVLLVHKNIEAQLHLPQIRSRKDSQACEKKNRYSWTYVLHIAQCL